MPRQVTTTLEYATDFPVSSHDIRQTVLTQTIFGHHRFDILVPFDKLEGFWKSFLTDAHTQLLGQPLTILLTAEDSFFFNRGQQLQFKGIVTHLDTGRDNDFAGSVCIGGYSPCQLLDSGYKKRTFRNQTLATIFAKVLAPFPDNILPRALAPVYQKPLPYVVQYQETNFEFLSRLAAEYGEWFYYDGQTLRLGPPPAGAEIQFQADGMYNNFRFRMGVLPSKEVLHAYNYQQHKQFQSSTASQQVPWVQGNKFAQYVLEQSERLYEEGQRGAGRGISSTGQLDEVALQARSKAMTNLVTVEGSSDNPDLTLGSVLNIQGKGLGSYTMAHDSFGKYRIIAITHTTDASGNYVNDFTAVPVQTLVPPAHPAVPPPMGIPEVAEVIDDKDPDKLGRLRLRYFWPVQNPQDAETDWVRVMTPYSGDGKGQMFNPEIGSQVLVSYEDSAPDKPLVLGNLFHANNPQGASYTRPGNHLKSIYDKSGNKIQLNAGILGLKSTAEAVGKLITITNANKESTGLELGFDGKGRVTIRTLGPVHVSGNSITLEAGNEGDIMLHAARIMMLAEENITAIAKDTLAMQANWVEAKGEEHIHLDGGEKLITSSNNTFHC